MTGAPIRGFSWRVRTWEGSLFWTYDFCVWSLLETQASSITHTCVEALKVSLVRDWAKIPQEPYYAVVNEFQEYLIWLFLLKVILKNEVTDWFLYIYILLYCIFFYLCVFWIIMSHSLYIFFNYYVSFFIYAYFWIIMSHIVLLTVCVYSSNHRVLYTIGISMTRFQKSVGPSVSLSVCLSVFL